MLGLLLWRINRAWAHQATISELEFKAAKSEDSGSNHEAGKQLSSSLLIKQQSPLPHAGNTEHLRP